MAYNITLTNGSLYAGGANGTLNNTSFMALYTVTSHFKLNIQKENEL
jgi:hypothetical protein